MTPSPANSPLRVRLCALAGRPSSMAARSLRKLAPLAVLLVSVLALSACSDNSHTRVTTGTYAGESGQNAPYLNVGPLTYEVQLSRELNPYDTEDSTYLSGLPPAQRKLGPGEEWFAVFLQVYNESSAPHVATTNISISDTQENVYTPIAPALTNEFAYRGRACPSQGPHPGARHDCCQWAHAGCPGAVQDQDRLARQPSDRDQVRGSVQSGGDGLRRARRLGRVVGHAESCSRPTS